MNKNFLLATHCDLDGCGSWVLSRYFNLTEFDNVLVMDYNFEESKDSIKETIIQYKEVLFADFCPNKEYLQKMLDLNIKTTVMDHHDSSQWVKEISHPLLTVFHDLNRCGTKIFFEEYIKPKFKRIPLIVYKFVDLVDVYDLWKLEDPLREESEDLNRLLYMVFNWNATVKEDTYLRFIDLMVKKLDTQTEWNWTRSELELITKSRNKEEVVYTQSKNILQTRTDDKGKIFGLFRARSKISMICSRLLKEFPKLDYIIAINDFLKDEIKLSARSTEEKFDCTLLENFDGHKGAAGGTVESFEYLEKFWNGLINSIPYKLLIKTEN